MFYCCEKSYTEAKPNYRGKMGYLIQKPEPKSLKVGGTVELL